MRYFGIGPFGTRLEAMHAIFADQNRCAAVCVANSDSEFASMDCALKSESTATGIRIAFFFFAPRSKKQESPHAIFWNRPIQHRAGGLEATHAILDIRRPKLVCSGMRCEFAEFASMDCALKSESTAMRLRIALFFFAPRSEKQESPHAIFWNRPIRHRAGSDACDIRRPKSVCGGMRYRTANPDSEFASMDCALKPLS